MFRSLLLSSALALVSLPALARENYALLIGANEYRNLDERWWLNGPANDVQLVRDYLLAEAPVPFAADHITMLTDNVDGVQPATLGAIRAAVADLTAKVQPGDFVYLHFSGHGTQAPAADPDSELDGLDELFLPVDIGKWDDRWATVENALVDDEIGQMIDGLRAKGADVWVVFDSCHSGTATRAVETGDDDVRVRQLDPGSGHGRGDGGRGQPLGRRRPARRPRRRWIVEAGKAPGGSFVAFFAAQTNEVTPEKKLPKGKPGRKPQGVFTYTLFETLAEYPGATYGQIAAGGAAPLFGEEPGQGHAAVRGRSRHRRLRSGEGGERVTQWQATLTEDGTFTIPAGIARAVGRRNWRSWPRRRRTEAAIGYVKMTSVDTFTTTAVPVARDAKGAARRAAQGPDAAQAGRGGGLHPDRGPAARGHRPRRCAAGGACDAAGGRGAAAEFRRRRAGGRPARWPSCPTARAPMRSGSCPRPAWPRIWRPRPRSRPPTRTPISWRCHPGRHADR
jgi:hypothetical protein